MRICVLIFLNLVFRISTFAYFDEFKNVVFWKKFTGIEC